MYRSLPHPLQFLSNPALIWQRWSQWAVRCYWWERSLCACLSHPIKHRNQRKTAWWLLVSHTGVISVLTEHKPFLEGFCHSERQEKHGVLKAISAGSQKKGQRWWFQLLEWTKKADWFVFAWSLLIEMNHFLASNKKKTNPRNHFSEIWKKAKVYIYFFYCDSFLKFEAFCALPISLVACGKEIAAINVVSEKWLQLNRKWMDFWAPFVIF